MRRNPPAQWTLPDVVDPATRLCVQVYVPDDPAHIAAFRGALLALQSAYNWQDDAAHTAKDVALVWREIIRDMGDSWGCDTGIQTIEFRQLANCPLEVSIDSGAWSTIYDGYNCAVGAISDAINDGTLATPGQPGADGSVPVDECWEYDVTLRGNGRWLCPVPVSAGYTVTVDNAQGGWADNNAITAGWSCPNGTAYALGACGDPLDTDPNDPLPTVSHTRLIGFCDDIYMDMYNTAYVVPEGTPQSHFLLQMNDASLSDNQGDITCHVTVCNYSEWCHLYDFTIDNQGWAAWTYNGQEFGHYYAGQGWTDNYPTDPIDGIVISPPAFDEATITRVIIEFSPSWGGASPYIALEQYEHSTLIKSSTATGAMVTIIPDTPVSLTRFTLWFDPYLGNQAHYDGYIAKIKVRGTGTNPFGTSNC